MKNKIINILRKTQKYTHTDNVYLAKNASSLVGKDIILTFVAFIMAILFARLLPKETYGQYKYVLSVLAILAITTLIDLPATLIRAVARGKEGMLNKVFRVRIKWGLLGSLASLALAFYYFHWANNSALAIIFALSAFVLPLIEALKTFPQFLEGKKLFNKEAKYQVISQILLCAATATSIFLTKNIILIIIVFFISNLLINGFFYILILIKYKTNDECDTETIQYGKELSLMNILALLSQEIDKILLFNFISPASLAVYSFAYLPILQINAILKNIRLVAYPKFASKTLSEIKKTIFKKLFLLSLMILAVIFVYIFLAPYVFKIFFPQYLDSISYSRWLSLTLLLLPATFLHSIFHAHMIKKQLYTLNIVNSLMSIILLSVFIYLWGLPGAIIARISHALFYILITSAVFLKKIKSLPA